MPNVKTASVTDTGHNNRTKYAKVSEEVILSMWPGLPIDMQLKTIILNFK